MAKPLHHAPRRLAGAEHEHELARSRLRREGPAPQGAKETEGLQNGARLADTLIMVLLPQRFSLRTRSSSPDEVDSEPGGRRHKLLRLERRSRPGPAGCPAARTKSPKPGGVEIAITRTGAPLVF